MNPVVVASALQYLLAVTFVLMPAVAYRYGNRAQRAAEDDVLRQGFPGDVLTRHRIRFAESAVETVFPLGIAACLAALASLNLAGADIGRILSWVLQPVMLVGGGLVIAGQLFPTRYIETALRRSDDRSADGIDVGAFVAAATAVFPGWFRTAVVTRFLLATVGSVAVLVLLSLPRASAHFR